MFPIVIQRDHRSHDYKGRLVNLNVTRIGNHHSHMVRTHHIPVIVYVSKRKNCENVTLVRVCCWGTGVDPFLKVLRELFQLFRERLNVIRQVRR